MGLRNTKVNPTANIPSPFKHVWLTTEKNIITEEIEQSLDDRMFSIEETSECIDYLNTASPQERIVLIIEEHLASRIVPSIHDQCAVKVIFVIRSVTHDPPCDEWSKPFIKVKSVSSMEQVAPQLKYFEARWLRTTDEFFSVNILQMNVNGQSEQSSNEINGSFLFMQLLIDILLRMTPQTTDRDELIIECMKEYSESPRILQDIRNFAEYYSETAALYLYTQQTFLYPLLNKALRVENVEVIYLYHFYIRDIFNELRQRQCNVPIKVYRGQLMSLTELARLKSKFYANIVTSASQQPTPQATYISMKSFLSTSLERNVAEFYVADARVGDTCATLLEIYADPTVCNQANPFAKLGTLSAIPNEEEVLFAVGSIFRVKDIREEDFKCIIALELCNNDDTAFKNVFDNLKKDYGGQLAGRETEANLNSFATVLFNMEKYDSADRFFRRFYNELPESHPDRARCCHNIGNVALEKRQYRESLRWLKRALALYRETKPLGHPAIATTYHCLANQYGRKKKYRQALDAYRVSMDMFRQNYGDDHPRIALCCASIAGIYLRQKNFEKAIPFFEKALDVSTECFPPYHPDRASMHYSLALAHRASGRQDLAFEHLQHALAIGLKTLTPNSALLSSIYAETAEIYRKMGNIQLASDYFEKAAAIANLPLSGSGQQLSDKVYFGCRRCGRFLWAYARFDRIEESSLVCAIFHSKLAFSIGQLCQ